MKKVLATMMALAVTGMMMTGCGEPSKTTTQPTTAPPQNSPASPKPASAQFTGKSADGRLEIKVVVASNVASIEMLAPDFTWKAPPANEPKNAPNVGHARLTLDSEKPVEFSSLRAYLKDLKPGKHTLKVELMNNDKSPMNIEAKVEFEVK